MSKNENDIKKMFETTGGIRKEIISDENRETKSKIWFSHIEDIWNAELKGTQKVFYWTDSSKCGIGIIAQYLGCQEIKTHLARK